MHNTFSDENIQTCEERLEVVSKTEKSSIGVPKEICRNEQRIALTPDAVQALAQAGHHIIIEQGAGAGSFFTDQQFSEAGAEITTDRKKVFGNDLIIKINPPCKEEIEMIRPGAFLISALQINMQEAEYFHMLAAKKVNALAFEFIQDDYGQRSLVKMIGEIAGSTAVLYGAELLSKSNGLLLGGITGVRPSEVVIIGAGMIGEFAAKAALGLRANVRIFDSSLTKLGRLHSIIPQGVPTSVLDPKELTKAIRRADLVIGALPRLNQKPIVTEDMVQLMKKGSVIIDLVVDYGKCIETSELTTIEEPYIIKHDVLHCGLPNITSKVSRSTSKAISNFFLSYLLQLDDEGGMENSLMRDINVKKSLYMYKGRHTQQKICDRFGLQFHDINLLIF